MIQKAKNYFGKDCTAPFFETQWRRKINIFPLFNYQNIIKGVITTQTEYLREKYVLNAESGDIVTNRT
jgi:hypothetical protein